MTIHTWWLFFAAVFLLCGTPGPNMLHVLTRSVRWGARRSIAAMAGCLTALIIVLAASAAGLSAVLIASPLLFDVVRYGGVAYLIYLGIRAWMGADAPIDLGADQPMRSLSLAALFRGGFIIGLSNPKLLLFATAFFPQFVDKSAPQLPQYAVLILTFAAAESFWYAVYGLGGQTLATYLTKPALKRAFNRVTGGIFIGFGAALLVTRP
ncbi:LysE family translocator [Hyphomicrobium sp. 2TAF46]|uniref:LysE family translocator n=1 Tax=Hyphomicrobium sp. 2TAF46 TaxID=3233019 RepID=UPI003F9048CE